MNPAEILAHFDRISEAPDAIPRLRRFILDLAVQGRLVEQDANDEPASELFARSFPDRRLPGNGGLAGNLSNASEGSMPSTTPQGWIECVIEDCFAPLEDGRTLHQGWSPQCENEPSHEEGSWAVLKTTSIQPGSFHPEHNKRLPTDLAPRPILEVAAGDILITCAGPRARCGVACVIRHTRRRLMISGKMYRFRVAPEWIEPQFIEIFLQCEEAQSGINRMKTGSSESGLNLTHERFRQLPIRIPPLAEQRRIVAKVAELMTLCNQLETVQADREKQRDRLVATSLQRLNQSTDADASAFREHARFHLQHFSRITKRPEQVPQVRETILNLAVRGYLVPQDPSDEPVVELLKQIQSEKERLVKAGVIPRQKLPLSDSGRLAFTPPAQWEVVRFGDICNFVTSGSRGWGEFYSDTGPRFIRAQNIRFGRLRLDDLACVNPPKKAEGARTLACEGDLLIVITGAGVTTPALLDRDLGEAYVSQHVALIRPTTTSLSKWLLMCLMAPAGGRAELIERAYGAGKPGLNLDNIRSLKIPLPPLAEQYRIVAKVEELMALCDQLETQLTTAQTESRLLLEAVLHEALAVA